MQKRHAHVSPTLDIMAKKIFSLPEVTAAFIRDILELDVADAQIVEGSQPHSMAYEEDDLFSTAVDVRAKLHDGTEVIIEIQIRKQQYFLNRFHYYLANQLVENVQKLRLIRCTSRWSPSMGLRFWRSRSYWTKRPPSTNTGLPIAGLASNSRPIIKMASTKIFCRLPF